MIWLLLALLFSTLIMVNFKLHPRFGIKTIQAITVNYLVASSCGFITLGHAPNQEVTNEPWAFLALLSGTFLILVFFVFAQSAKKVGIALTSVSSKMSVIIPVSLGFIIFAEPITPNKLIGIAVALPAFVLILSKKANAGPIDRRLLVLPVLLFFGNGLNDSILKTAQFNFLSTDAAFTLYLSYAFSISLVIGFFILMYQIIFHAEKIHVASLLAGVVLGLLNWFSTLFFLKGLDSMDVSVFIPVFNVGIVSLGALTGTIIFREQLSRKNIFGFLLAIASILLIALNNV